MHNAVFQKVINLKRTNKMDKKITLVLWESELEIIQDAMSIASTQSYHQELCKRKGIDNRVLSAVIEGQTKFQLDQ